MSKTINISTILLIVIVPVTVLLLSFNLTFRFPATYSFYFTDTQAVSKLGFEIEDSEVTHEIAAYLSNPKDNTFQVYEKTGNYKDRVFGIEDQRAMRSAKKFLFWEGIAGLSALALSLGVFFGTSRKAADDRDLYQFVMRGFGIGSVLLLAASDILALIPAVRKGFYRWIFGVKLSKNSALHSLITAGFPKTYCIMSTVIGVVLLLLFIFLFYRRYRPRGRIFY
ncbi:MAG: DUF1461 domain-containing protein [Eubacteriales bacterium]|nr:DUF1461 domain-containing protein [Eubacteriales bacterium]